MVRKLGSGADRPRERILRLGPGALRDEDLLAVMLGTGRRGQPVEGLARELLQHAGGLKQLLVLEPSELCALSGIGQARAAQLLAALELGRRAQRSPDRRPRLGNPMEIYQHLAPSLSALRREVFHVLCLNNRNVLLRDARVAQGSTNQCPVDPREVFSAALAAGASAIVLAHNHPTGDPRPSELDIALTAQLTEGGRVLGIRVLDHLVIGDGAFTSMAQLGLVAGATLAPGIRLAGQSSAPAHRLTGGPES